MTTSDASVAAADFDPFAGPPLARAVPSTEPQREIWTATEVGEDANLAYNESIWLRMRGPLDEGALRQSLHEVALRHEALRSMFSGDGTQLLVGADITIPWRSVDVSKE